MDEGYYDYINFPRTKKGQEKAKKYRNSLLKMILFSEIGWSIILYFEIAKFGLVGLFNIHYVSIFFTIYVGLILFPLQWYQSMGSALSRGIRIEEDKIIFPGYWGILSDNVYRFREFSDIKFGNECVNFYFSKYHERKNWLEPKKHYSYNYDYIFELDDFKEAIEKNRHKLADQ
ncbi:MAG: hypothetical protein KGY76_06550 [Candidatus Thermoplasmatota archaeon]|nr:hypothetical protein [Candidatus Thermoplasmatota archaeon]